MKRMLERIVGRRAELDELVKQLDEVLAARDELAVTERVLGRLQEQMAAEEVPVVAVGQASGRPMPLVPHRAPGIDEQALPPEYRKRPEVVHDADEPVVVKDACSALDVGIEAPHRGDA